jgi:hypothetical protein
MPDCVSRPGGPAAFGGLRGKGVQLQEIGQPYGWPWPGEELGLKAWQVCFAWWNRSWHALKITTGVSG